MKYYKYENLFQLLKQNNTSDFTYNPQFWEIAYQINAVKEEKDVKFMDFKGIECNLIMEKPQIHAENLEELPIQENANFICEKYFFGSYIRNRKSKISTRLKYDKYAVFKPQNEEFSGNVWREWKVGGVFFALENCPVPLNDSEKLISVITNTSDNEREINFYNRSQIWLGKMWTEKSFPWVMDVKFVVSPSALNLTSTDNENYYLTSEIKISSSDFDVNPFEIVKSKIQKKKSELKKVYLPISKRNCHLTEEQVCKFQNANRSLNEFGII